MNRLYRQLLLLLLIVIVMTGMVSCRSLFENRDRDVRNLEKIFATIKQYQAQAYRNQDWCKNLYYLRGKFSNNNEASTCNLFPGPAQAFDNQATSDFASLAKQLASTGVQILFFEVKFDDQGEIKNAQFQLDCSFCSRPRYVYEPHYGNLPEDMRNEIWHTKINENWYLVEEDWN
ncbi:MAG: hypothetical protein AB1489_23305 [Acidobacteriota bacterium]